MMHTGHAAQMGGDGSEQAVVVDVQWPQVLERLLAREDLNEDEAVLVLGAVMRGDVPASVVSALLVALRAKGEAPSEIAGFVRAMLEAAEPIEIAPEVAARMVDVVGTGGDGAGTFNVSTVSAVVVAAAGVPVAKHGNRAASSLCGSADLLEAWGVDLTLDAQQVATCIEEIGIGFLFARSFHPSMRVVGPIRQELGIRTTFNVLGPLSNPAGAPFQAVGVADQALAGVMADALGRLGRRALVFRGNDGLDELTTTAPNDVWDVTDGEIHRWSLDPTSLGIARARPTDLVGGDAEQNAAIADAVLAGELGPRADIVVLNAGAALWVAGAVDDLADGVELARQVLTDGAARELKEQWVARTQELAAESS
jgi:anthranilate phosphoribosyltransferase